MSALLICEFNTCANVAVLGSTKCLFHKHRLQCAVPACRNQVYARHLCARHGGKRPCAVDNCGQTAQVNGHCLAHGGATGKKQCVEAGCLKQAQAHQRCLKHGGGRRCTVPGCVQHVRSQGLCRSHLRNEQTTVHVDLEQLDPTAGLCKYAYKPCTNERALKRDGSLHTLCDYHRKKTNHVQKTYNAKKRDESAKVLSIDPIPFFSKGGPWVSLDNGDMLDFLDLTGLVLGDATVEVANLQV
ncbi:Aste57867_4763 [Aphanomyces stellatus]|uniref:Aste57867_4763 protein n=1 Tax=Aphanomyces stellatus TaxID=120398 RepID=A0A485KGC8_9STRA|nr:hypothetical protein As57867_004750 [Aphanomyces stellatus]VFT81859.1 Aste57867_4763 [Aphanomyces stellatus]